MASADRRSSSSSSSAQMTTQVAVLVERVDILTRSVEKLASSLSSDYVPRGEHLARWQRQDELTEKLTGAVDRLAQHVETLSHQLPADYTSRRDFDSAFHDSRTDRANLNRRVEAIEHALSGEIRQVERGISTFREQQAREQLNTMRQSLWMYGGPVLGAVAGYVLAHLHF